MRYGFWFWVCHTILHQLMPPGASYRKLWLSYGSESSYGSWNSETPNEYIYIYTQNRSFKRCHKIRCPPLGATRLRSRKAFQREDVWGNAGKSQGRVLDMMDIISWDVPWCTWCKPDTELDRDPHCNYDQLCTFWSHATMGIGIN